MRFISDISPKYIFGGPFGVWKDVPNGTSEMEHINSYCRNELNVYDTDSAGIDEYYFRYSTGKCYMVVHEYDPNWVHTDEDESDYYVDNIYHISEIEKKDLPSSVLVGDRDWILYRGY